MQLQVLYKNLDYHNMSFIKFLLLFYFIFSKGDYLDNGFCVGSKNIFLKTSPVHVFLRDDDI